VPFLAYSDYQLTGRGEANQFQRPVAGNFFHTLDVQPELEAFHSRECRRPPLLRFVDTLFWRQQFSRTMRSSASQ